MLHIKTKSLNSLKTLCLACCLLGSNSLQAQEPDTTLPIVHDASSLEWELWGFNPEGWRYQQVDPEFRKRADTRGIPATVPGSVQLALKNAGIIKDWNIGLNSRESEWV